MTEEELILRLDRDARRLARRFDLKLRVLQQESPHVKARLGSCDSDGTIRIRLRNRRTGDYLKYSSMVSTLCHELAHLRHLPHGPDFRALYSDIIAYARTRRIYRPGRRRPMRRPTIGIAARRRRACRRK